MSRDDSEPTAPAPTAAVEQPTAVLPEAPPAGASPATPEPTAPPTRPSSRGWLIGGIAAGGALLLALAFGGGVATGFALDSGRGGPAAEFGDRGFRGGDPGQGWGDRDGDRPAPGAPQQDQDQDQDSTAPNS